MKKELAWALALACVSVSGKAATLEPSVTSRTVSCHESDVIPVNTEVNYVTMLRFAQNQNIVGAFWGDTDRWAIDKQSNLLMVKASVKGTKTDLHVVLSGGDVCSFAIAEVSNDKATVADIKLYVSTTHDQAPGASDKPAFYSAEQVEALKQSATDAQRALQDEKAAEQKRAASELTAARVQADASLQHGYQYKQTAKLAAVFGVKSIYREGDFTFIEASPKEAPAVYEVKDGKPSLIEYELDGQTHRYRIPKLLDKGYMRVGKSKLDFTWQG